jgi:hypothetical protein
MASKQLKAIKDLVQSLREVRAEHHQAEFEETYRNAIEMADHGEWGVGLEILCENLFEYNFPLPKLQFDQILSLGSMWGTDTRCIERLRDLIVVEVAQTGQSSTKGRS